MSIAYHPQEIEKKWQRIWNERGLYRSVIDETRPKFYYLTMLPYPSGDLHIGHWYAMTPSDAQARFYRMQGYNVLFPMGFDAFGLPAENAAIRRGIHPSTWTHQNIDYMRRQLRSMGAMFDWEREMVSCEPEYYKWNQWFFIKMYEKGLAYRKKAAVDFCPSCNTTLAREQVMGPERVCERCGTPVIKKELEQWFFRITDYADELLDFSGLEWPERVKTLQRNWIGRSEGAEVVFKSEQGDPLVVFTTRPDTLWGATFMVMAPEHPLVKKLTTPAQKDAVQQYVRNAQRMADIERESAEREKTGVFSGAYAINPVNSERIPIWIADYVLMTYGTGAIMAVPAHDERDFAFATKYNLPIRVVIAPPGWDGQPLTKAYSGEGVMINSGVLDGTPTPAGIKKVVAWLEEKGLGKHAVNYRLHDWLISRQRYWGTPIPMIHCPHCGVVPVPEDQLPVELPTDVTFRATGENPLTYHDTFLHVKCPVCGGDARRETDTMDTFMDSSWYHYRYLSPHYDEAPWDPKEGAYWLPVDQYTGGIEHATMHLLYTRFFTKALRDLGLVDLDEPMLRLFNQGTILGEPQDGDFVAVTGRWQDDAFLAERIDILVRPQDGRLPREGLPTYLLSDDMVRGEVWQRDEGGLKVRIESGEADRIVVVNAKGATILFDGQPMRLMDVQMHLEVEKMSKSKGNVVAPDILVDKYGADTVRAYLMFAFDWGSGGPWNSRGIEGTYRWLNRVWALIMDDSPVVGGQADPATVRQLRRKTHQTIRKVTHDVKAFAFNTAIAALMELTNLMKKLQGTPVRGTQAWAEAVESMILMMAPFTPHIAEEMWHQTGHAFSVHTRPWPVWDEEAAKEEVMTLVIQVNGKLRDKIEVPVGIGAEQAKALALKSEAVQRHISGKTIRKIIFAANKLVNIVAK